MYIHFTSIIALYIIQLSSSTWVRYNWFSSPHNARKHFVEMAAQDVLRAQTKMFTLNHIRYKYEVSPHFEIGYMIGEIIERYRKLFDIVRDNSQYTDMLFQYLHRLMLSQFLFLEVYHLIGMLHEIPRKYAYDPDFQDIFGEEWKIPKTTMSEEQAEHIREHLSNLQKEHEKKKFEVKYKLIEKKKIKHLFLTDQNVDLFKNLEKQYGKDPSKWPPEVVKNFPGGDRAINMIADYDSTANKFGPHSINPPRTRPPKSFWKEIFNADWDYGWEVQHKWLIGNWSKTGVIDTLGQG